MPNCPGLSPVGCKCWYRILEAARAARRRLSLVQFETTRSALSFSVCFSSGIHIPLHWELRVYARILGTVYHDWRFPIRKCTTDGKTPAPVRRRGRYINCMSLRPCDIALGVRLLGFVLLKDIDAGGMEAVIFARADDADDIAALEFLDRYRTTFALDADIMPDVDSDFAAAVDTDPDVPRHEFVALVRHATDDLMRGFVDGLDDRTGSAHGRGEGAGQTQGARADGAVVAVATRDGDAIAVAQADVVIVDSGDVGQVGVMVDQHRAQMAVDADDHPAVGIVNVLDGAPQADLLPNRGRGRRLGRHINWAVDRAIHRRGRFVVVGRRPAVVRELGQAGDGDDVLRQQAPVDLDVHSVREVACVAGPRRIPQLDDGVVCVEIVNVSIGRGDGDAVAVGVDHRHDTVDVEVLGSLIGISGVGAGDSRSTDARERGYGDRRKDCMFIAHGYFPFACTSKD